jgi:hypothetical protein
VTDVDLPTPGAGEVRVTPEASNASTAAVPAAARREVIERYFERHKEDAQIRQIELAGVVDDDGVVPEGYCEPLFEELMRIGDSRDPASRPTTSRRRAAR